jgi:hypothetical protein
MKPIIKLSAILIAILLFNNATAAEDITGTWQGKLTLSPETELKVQFIISQGDDGSYAVILNSPDEGAVKNVKADSVSYDSGSLKLDVAELSGSYEGVVKDGKIEGTWKQEGTSMPLILTPYVKPTLSKEDKEKLSGTWHGKVERADGIITIIYHFEITEDGDLVGFTDSPDQGAFNVPVTDIMIEDGVFSLKVPSVQGVYEGKIEGDEIIGVFQPGTLDLPLILKKGEFVYNLNLTEEDMEKLLGEWNGPLTTPTASLTVVFRFDKMKGGNFVAFLDCPGIGWKGVPVTEATRSDGKLTLKMETINAEFNGELAGDEMVGEWTYRRNSSLPLTLKKGEYRAPVYSLSFSKEEMDQLSGKWQGQLGPLPLVFRFEKTDKGEFLGFLDSPDEGSKGIPITEATLSDGKLTLKINNIEYSGQLSDSSLVGEWKQAGQSHPLTFTKK